MYKKSFSSQNNHEAESMPVIQIPVTAPFVKKAEDARIGGEKTI